MRARGAAERSDIGKSSFHPGVTAAARPRHDRRKINRSAPTETLELSVFTEALRALGNLFGPAIGGNEDYRERDAAPTLKSAAASITNRLRLRRRRLRPILQWVLSTRFSLQNTTKLSSGDNPNAPAPGHS
jgi:hypothetical protein